MADARQASEWSRQAFALAVLVNAQRPKGKTPVKVDDLNPYRKRETKAGSIQDLKKLLGRGTEAKR